MTRKIKAGGLVAFHPGWIAKLSLLRISKSKLETMKLRNSNHRTKVSSRLGDNRRWWSESHLQCWLLTSNDEWFLPRSTSKPTKQQNFKISLTIFYTQLVAAYQTVCKCGLILTHHPPSPCFLSLFTEHSCFEVNTKMMVITCRQWQFTIFIINVWYMLTCKYLQMSRSTMSSFGECKSAVTKWHGKHPS